MAGSSLFALIDDIATLLDDVAVMTKVAAKKTAGVLGDDLALNAQQVAGIRAERELPVVWAVAKGSLLNKVILVPAALLISAIAPALILPLLMLGGLYLCFEGVEKVWHTISHPKEAESEHQQLVEAVANEDVDLVAFEKEKIKGAIRTDFVLSAEIIVIALGTVATTSLLNQFMVLAGIAVVMTIGVYGIVAAIVKLDDMGFYLIRQAGHNPAKRLLGQALVNAAPRLMKFLSVAGTIAMFMVGGGIISHAVSAIHHLTGPVVHAATSLSPYLEAITASTLDAAVGIAAGSVLVLLLNGVQKLRGKTA